MKEHATSLVDILRECHTLQQAKERMVAVLGHEPTTDSLRSMFRREGLDSPTSYLIDGDDCKTIQMPVLSRGGGEAARVAFIPDVHAPFHDRRAFDCALEGIDLFLSSVPKDQRTLVIQGDFIDCLSVSRHSKDPKRRVTLADEIASANELLDAIDALDVGRKIYCEGNHETRLSRFIADKCPEFNGLVEIRQLLEVDERNYEWVAYGKFGRVGSMLVTHDVELCGKYAVQRSGDELSESIAIGHIHRMGIHHGANVLGQPRMSCSFGWLGDFATIDYRHRAKVMREWVHGFGVGYIDATGFVRPVGVPIIAGQCVVEGHVVGKRAA